MPRLRLIHLLVVAALAAPLSLAQTAAQKRPMTFEDMMHMKRLGDTAVSRDGRWLVYSSTTVNLAENTKTAELWIMPVAGGEPQPVAVCKPGDSGLQFADDGRHILFLSSREHGQQVWIADFDPETGATANARRVSDIATEADNAQWSPDGRFIIFTSDVYPDCPVIHTEQTGDSEGNRCNAERDKALADSKVKAQIFTGLLFRHWDRFTGDKRSHLFQLTLATGALRDLNPGAPHNVPPFSLEGGGCGCSISPDSKELASTENLDPVPAISISASIFTLDLSNPTAKPVKVSTSLGGNFNPAYSPDGKYLAWRSQERAGYESDQFRLALYDRATKKTKNLLPDLKTWVDEFAWTADSKRILFVSGKDGEAPLFVTDLNGRFMLFNNTGEFGGMHPLADGATIVASWMTVKNPMEAVRISYAAHLELCKGVCDPSGAGVDAITHLNDRLLSELDQPAMEDFWFNAEDGTRLQGFLIRPPGFDPSKKYPVKFLIHGGPQGAWGNSWSYRWNAELFAANGYVVVMVNPRGSTGYGQE
ncbi:MAG: prolyl oligopeptidase family serine peptidase, partial [Acidobacteriaceae bacterium]|nr:prolyl oligopeptidase family serine peptidase [Acidobacteriaceae bacterium]